MIVTGQIESSPKPRKPRAILLAHYWLGIVEGPKL
jgi:hypothetical protein